jgi:ABC-2 type transport system ATP-binding protein
MLTSMSAPALQLWKVVKRYGFRRKHEALREVSLSVAQGEVFGLAGPNGAGKTTLIKLLLGLTMPDEGEVRLFGRRPDDPRVRQRVGFVPESVELPPAASPRALVRRVAKLRGIDSRSFVPRGIEQLQRLGMGELLDRPAGKLSKGEKQRTLLALSLMPDPELLVLDEPTDGLDPLGRALVRRVLREEQQRGRTIFLNSHLLSETEKVCTRIAILNRGRVVREHEVRQHRETSTEVVLSEGSLVVEHDDLRSLNLQLDRLRQEGKLISEVRRVREDLETTFEAAVLGADRQQLEIGPQPPEPEPGANDPLRMPKAVLRVAAEIVEDLRSRRIGWIVFAIAVALVLVSLWALHSELAKAAQAAAKTWRDSFEPATFGKYTAEVLFWALLSSTAIFASFFAPPLLDPRRSVFLLAQPVGRGDLAGGIFLAVCGFTLAEYVFIDSLMFGGLRFLGVAVDPRFLLVPLAQLVGFGAIYAVELAVSYVISAALAACAIGLALIIVTVALSAHYDSAWLSLLPRLNGLSTQASHFGQGHPAAPAPFVETLLFIGAFLLFTLFLARRSER